jgi:hypothetical protein
VDRKGEDGQEKWLNFVNRRTEKDIFWNYCEQCQNYAVFEPTAVGYYEPPVFEQEDGTLVTCTTCGRFSHIPDAFLETGGLNQIRIE